MIFTSPTPETTTCGACPLRSHRLCRALHEFSCESGREHTPRLRTVEAETRLQEEDDRPQFSGILRQGYLRTERILTDGRRSVLSFLAPGDLIGDVLGSVRGPALVAATDAEFCAFDPAALRRAMQEDGRLNVQFLSEAMKQHTRQLEMLWRRGALNSRERVIAFMVMAMEFVPTRPLPDGSVVLTVMVSRKDWADFCNTTVETISRTMAYLSARRLVETLAPSRYRIRDLDRLADLAGLDCTSDPSAMLAELPPAKASHPGTVTPFRARRA